MSALIQGIKENDFVIVGRAGIDFFTDVGVRAEDAEHVTVDLGGSAANIQRMCAAWGANTGTLWPFTKACSKGTAT